MLEIFLWTAIERMFRRSKQFDVESRLSGGEGKERKLAATERQVDLLIWTLAYLKKLAEVDLSFNEDEQAYLHEIAEDMYKLVDKYSIYGLQISREEVFDKAMNFVDVPDAFFETARGDRPFRTVVMIYCWRLAARDDQVTKEELEFIRKTGLDLGFSTFELDSIRIPYYREDAPDERLYGISRQGAKIILAHEGYAIRCMMCGTEHEAPEPGLQGDARCSHCHALLLYPRETAEELYDHDEPLLLRMPVPGKQHPL